MGLRQTISEWVATIRDALDFGPEFPAAMEARHAMFAEESARLQQLLEQNQKASQEKDQLIAKLQTAGAVAGTMVVDGPAYYIRKANTLEGPFCTSCFQRNHEITRIAPAPKPPGNGGTPADWVQCTKCKTPFRSDRISQYLNPARAPAANGSPVGVLLQPDKARPASPTGPATARDDKRQKTENRGQTTEDGGHKAQSQPHPSAVLYQPPSDQQREPASGPAQNSAPGVTAATQEDTSAAPSLKPVAKPPVDSPKPPSAPAAAADGESDTAKEARTARKPRREPRRGTARLAKTPSGETGPAPQAPPASSIALARPAPMPKPALEAPRPIRTRSRTRKPKDR